MSEIKTNGIDQTKNKTEYPSKYFPSTPYNIETSETEPKQKYFTRVGTLPYFEENGNIYILFGIDSKFGSYCDFGGKSDLNESWKNARRREFNEESYGLIEYSDPNLYISTYRSLLVFSKIDIINNKTCDRFFDEWSYRKGKTPKCFHETKKAAILPLEVFSELVRDTNRNSLWGYIKDMCSDNIDTIIDILASKITDY